jgi:sulfopyruvate decarboxylase TPP-binding subunit
MSKEKFIVGVPCSKFKWKIDYSKAIIATKEDEAIAMAVGASLMGKETQVFMQNSGLGNCVDIITSLLIPYKISIPLFISVRRTPEHHKFMGEITRKLLDLLTYTNYELLNE